MTADSMTTLDPVEVGIIWSRISSIADEMVSARAHRVLNHGA